MPRWEFGPLLFTLVQNCFSSATVEGLSINCLFKIRSQHLNWVQVTTLTRSLWKYNLVWSLGLLWLPGWVVDVLLEEFTRLDTSGKVCYSAEFFSIWRYRLSLWLFWVTLWVSLALWTLRASEIALYPFEDWCILITFFLIISGKGCWKSLCWINWTVNPVFH